MSTTPELNAVARAIYEVLSDERHEWSKLKEISEQHGYSNAKATRELFLLRASAALLAIREPTEAMLKAMGVDHAKDRDGYTAAIDHILGETEGRVTGNQ